MGGTTTSNNSLSNFISVISKDYPQFLFQAGTSEHWSPKTNTITYNPSEPFEDLRFGLLHELAHALLGHRTYGSDFELLRMESEAWKLASEISSKYDIAMDNDHIQDCLDTYRDWLHRRSACPSCGMHVMQVNSCVYECFNCQTEWSVTTDRFVRAYRRQFHTKKMI